MGAVLPDSWEKIVVDPDEVLKKIRPGMNIF
mgnify:CR=1 FL=1